MALVADGFERPSQIRVTDGSEWISSELDHRSQTKLLKIFNIEHVADRWIALGATFDEEGEPLVHAWSSADAVTWEFVGQPDFVTGDERIVQNWPSLGGWPTLVIKRGEDAPISELWVTTDGTEWQRALAARNIMSYAVVNNGDGTHPGIYSGAKPQPEDS